METSHLDDDIYFCPLILDWPRDEQFGSQATCHMPSPPKQTIVCETVSSFGVFRVSLQDLNLRGYLLGTQL